MGVSHYGASIFTTGSGDGGEGGSGRGRHQDLKVEISDLISRFELNILRTVFLKHFAFFCCLILKENNISDER